MPKIFNSTTLDSLTWSKVNVTLPATMCRYRAKFEDLTLTCDVSNTEHRKEGWKGTLRFIAYRNFIVNQGKTEVLNTGNNDHVNAFLEYYKKYKTFPKI